MTMRHLLLEVFCDHDKERNKDPQICILGSGNPTDSCFENKCKYLSYTKTSNELVYVNENGLDEYSIAFGGEMLPEDEKDDKKMLDIWKKICIKKIEEAYEEYNNLKNR